MTSLRAQQGTKILYQDTSVRRFFRVSSPAKARKSARSYTRKITTQFDDASTERLLSSINTAALAHGSSNVENQLISLWSSIEILLSSPPSQTARIIHYANELVPLICVRHMRRKIVAAFDQLAAHYGRRFRRIVNKESHMGDVDQHTKFAAVLCLKDNDNLQNELLSLCSQNPLALQRMSQINASYKTPKSFLSSLESHEKRVAWQVHRIYRARNNLVHAGNVPTYLASLVINMDEYFRAAIGTLIHRASKQNGKTPIDQLVFEIAVEYRLKFTILTDLKIRQDKARDDGKITPVVLKELVR